MPTQNKGLELDQELPDLNSEAGPRDIFTDLQACRYLGVSPVTLWRERKAKRISFRRIGGSIRYTYSDLAEYMDRCKQPSMV